MKRILVSGGAGFIGSHLCTRLINEGHDVICLDNFFTGSKDNIIHLMDNHHFEVVRHDVTYPYSAEVDEIYNLACPASPIHYQHDPIQTAKTSVMGAINMLGLAMRLDAKILQASTSEVYGDPIVHPQPESYWGNVNPVGYRSCYDEGKRCAETLFMDYHRQNSVRVKIIRIFNTYGPRMLPTYDPKRNISMQIVADGPENFEEILHGGFIKMILAAEKRVWLQSPYLIPDDTMINALLIAVRSGIDVRIMIPSMPDHPFIYRATQYYANYLTKRGVKVYLYQEGFIHAKTVIMDDTIASFGTTNQDIRSYSLNFEVSAFVYNRDVVDTLTGHFEDDMTRCILLTNEMIAEQSYWLRFKQSFSRLLSPIL